ncbi:hypothetical protein Tco_0980754 [Tanacetum coccineum]
MVVRPTLGELSAYGYPVPGSMMLYPSGNEILPFSVLICLIGCADFVSEAMPERVNEIPVILNLQRVQWFCGSAGGAMVERSDLGLEGLTLALRVERSDLGSEGLMTQPSCDPTV